MPDDAPTPPPGDPGFPYLTAAASLAALFLFVGLVFVAYRSPNYLGGGTLVPKADPVAKLNEVRGRNQAVLGGTDAAAKMPIDRATAEVLARTEATKDAKNKYGRLPFPVPPPPAPPADKK